MSTVRDKQLKNTLSIMQDNDNKLNIFEKNWIYCLKMWREKLILNCHNLSVEICSSHSCDNFVHD